MRDNPRMPSVAEQIAERLRAPDSFDPADVDTLGDDTTAGRRRSIADVLASDKSASAPLLPLEKRLRMRAAVPELKKYKGKKVDRREAFGEDDVDSGTDVDDMPPPIPPMESDEEEGDAPASGSGMSGSAAGGFSISGDLEAEYDRMMKKTSKELEVMRKPSESEVTKRREEAQRLKRQLDAWNSLVEFRIHLESAMSLAHRLPVGKTSQAFREADPAIASSGEGVAKEMGLLLGELLALQGRLAQRSELRESIEEADREATSGEGEAAAWATLDGRIQRVLDWSLGTADHWKERTRLDTRKSFKVLDQSFRMQMQAVSEVAPEKLRKRCTPPPGRHKVFGAAAGQANADTEAEQPQGDAGGEEEIFDDRDFYVQLLREVLGTGASKAGGLSDEAKEMQMELQGRRAKKVKARAEVERRASKGRKIRYVPIVKLQNFCAPRPRNGGSIEGVTADPMAFQPLQDGAVDALLRSLFAPDPTWRMP